LLNRFTHKRKIKNLSTLDVTWNLLVVDIWIIGSCFILTWMEGNFEIQVGVLSDVSLFWSNCEVFAVDLGIPSEMSFDISKVRKLKHFGKSASFDYRSETNAFFHELELNSMRYTMK
jgi:hypothetical protein